MDTSKDANILRRTIAQMQIVGVVIIILSISYELIQGCFGMCLGLSLIFFTFWVLPIFILSIVVDFQNKGISVKEYQILIIAAILILFLSSSDAFSILLVYLILSTMLIFEIKALKVELTKGLN